MHVSACGCSPACRLQAWSLRASTTSKAEPLWNLAAPCSATSNCTAPPLHLLPALPQKLDLNTAEAHHIASFPFTTSANVDAVAYLQAIFGEPWQRNPHLLAFVSGRQPLHRAC